MIDGVTSTRQAYLFARISSVVKKEQLESSSSVQRLVLLGRGGKDEVEDSLVFFGKVLGFEVVVIDHSPVLTKEPDVLIKGADYDISNFNFRPSDSVVVLTHGEDDATTLAKISKSVVRYIGLLASRQRASGVTEEMKKNGVPESFVDSIRSPVGADIGAVTSSEIALSIMTEIIGTKYGKALPSKDQNAAK